MAWPSYEGRSFGTCDRVSFRPLKLAMDAAGIPSMVDGIGCFMVAILDHPYIIREGGNIVAQSSLWLIAVMPHQLSTGEMTGAFGHLPLYRHDRSEAPGTWGKWHWDGNVEMPTLDPSIGSTGMNESPPTGWHGYLRAGHWQGV